MTQQAIERMPDCVSEPKHGQMILRPVEGQTEDQKWCGVWYDCPRCHTSFLRPSPELAAWLDEQKARQEAAEVARNES